MAQNSIEKIAQQYAVRLAPETRVHSGDYIFVRPKHVMTHDNTGAVIPKFRSIGVERVARPEQPVFTLDHNVQDRSEENLAKYRTIAEFALEQGVTAYPAGAGIGHQLMLEEGFVTPDRWWSLPTPTLTFTEHWPRLAHPWCAPTPQRSGPAARHGGRCPRWSESHSMVIHRRNRPART